MEKVVPTTHNLTKVNVPILAIVAVCMLLSLLAMAAQFFLMPILLNEATFVKYVTETNTTNEFSVEGWSPKGTIYAGESPIELNVSLRLKNPSEDDIVEVYTIADKKKLEFVECPMPEYGEKRFVCQVPLKFRYLPNTEFEVYPILVRDHEKYAAGHFPVQVDWRRYMQSFWSFSEFLIIIALLGMALCVAVIWIVLSISGRTVHEVAYTGEYSLRSILVPFVGRNAEEKYWGFISSPFFWTVEIVGIFLVILYMAFEAEVFNSAESLFSFVISGALAFPTPLIFAALFWLGDYKEREPLPVVVSLFLWGGLSCLLVLGINSISQSFLMVLGLGFIFPPFIAPVVEELFKGFGLVVFSLHHEFDDMVDGIVYGFVIGMGFTFVENWFYLVANPIGANAFMWSLIFLYRSFFFTANHGVFTAFSGAVIGYLKQRKNELASYGLFVGVLPAIFLHFAHNFVTVISAAGGVLGALIFSFLFLPVFDSLGLIFVVLLMAYGISRERKVE